MESRFVKFPSVFVSAVSCPVLLAIFIDSWLVVFDTNVFWCLSGHDTGGCLSKKDRSGHLAEGGSCQAWSHIHQGTLLLFVTVYSFIQLLEAKAYQRQLFSSCWKACYSWIIFLLLSQI